MDFRYLALSRDAEDKGGYPLADKLQRLGLERRGQVRWTTLFASKETPILPLPSGALLLGDLYERNGRAVTSVTCFRHHSTQRALRQHLLDHYWGEYLLIQPSDEQCDVVSVMRDPSGGITCVHSLNGAFVTSSPSMAEQLGLHRRQVDWEFIEHCLAYPYMKISRTGLADVRELLPGCSLSVSNGATRTELTWSPWRFVAPTRRQHDPAAAAQTIHQVTSSVVHAMAETDGSLLLELSGGLDSSIVGVCLADTRAKITACNVISPLPGADERYYARQVTDRLGIELLQGMLDFEEAGIAFPLPPDSLRPAVSPLARMATRIIDRTAVIQGVNSIYSGGGGDTIFGYLNSAAPAADALLSRGPATCWRAIVDLSRLHRCTVAKAARLTLRKLRMSSRPTCESANTLLTRGHPAQPLELHPWVAAPADALPGDRERICNLAGNQLFADVMLRSDRRRVRMPLLSQPVMEACLSVPSWMWISGGRNRAIARDAFAEQLPQDVLQRRSKGTFMNYTFAIYRNNKEAIRRFLLDGHLHARGLLDPDALNQFLDTPLKARDQSFMRAFELCMIENWIRNHA